MTNSQKIRAMTDEELANMFYKHEYGIYCHVGESTINNNCYKYESCYHCWLDWLKQEVKDNG